MYSKIMVDCKNLLSLSVFPKYVSHFKAFIVNSLWKTNLF